MDSYPFLLRRHHLPAVAGVIVVTGIEFWTTAQQIGTESRGTQEKIGTAARTMLTSQHITPMEILKLQPPHDLMKFCNFV